MLSKRYLSSVFTIATATLLLVSPSVAQREIHHVPPLINPDGNNPDLAQPFIEPFTFGSDFQFFALADYGDFGNGPDANTGFFATFDRLYIWVTRPDDQVAPRPWIGSGGQTLADQANGDFGWGNRFDLGYMSEEDHGWMMSFWHLDGPNYFDQFVIERVDVIDLADAPDTTIDLRGGGTGNSENPNLQTLPRRDENNFFTDDRSYIINNSVNASDLTSWEVNKTFRARSLHYGSVVEPFFGFRYAKFQDFFRRDTYQRYDDTTGAPLGPGLPIPPSDITNFFIEDFRTMRAQFDNHLVGGQLGLRWFKQKERWNLSGELRVFAFQNFQSFTTSDNLERTYFQSLTVDGDIDTVVYDRDETAAHTTEFVFGTEIRAEAAYAVTRDFQLRAGMAFMEFGRGIGRGASVANNDQDVTMIGATFGFNVNR